MDPLASRMGRCGSNGSLRRDRGRRRVGRQRLEIDPGPLRVVHAGGPSAFHARDRDPPKRSRALGDDGAGHLLLRQIMRGPRRAARASQCDDREHGTCHDQQQRDREIRGHVSRVAGLHDAHGRGVEHGAAVTSRRQDASGTNADPDENDPLFNDAVQLVFEFGKASTSLLQRRLRIGYGRAAHLIDLMERDGLVGPADGSRPRELLKAPGWLHEVTLANE